ncbi:MAG: MarR family transcriptional regulator [Gammaproteobacteria bacterium]|jgi:DNA-binding MarR family transcriptional regulator|nr:MarR family transcriptional regulator [Chromatiales bacterium]MCP4925256.1 MarR family transcriptional regulator [Gammaproteobacteria bacterium]MDP7153499.1 MarR family transcriptional regulator [Gammaproteobacteria bacterium]MDP7296796.1 MarR family transcriptional regulator [Gammaproteobacteria bacterium]MDP7419374.1 MarR family transcriptional regulator [Gammaproteobacteria bacterium]
MPDRNLFEIAVDALPPAQHRMRVWLALLGCFTSVERSLRRRFNHVFNSSLPRYDVLTALVQFPDGLTMGQLASKLMVSKGNVTGVVRRLRQDQCVRQARSRKDRRVQVVTLTVKGRTLWEQMHAEYRLVIEELLTRLSKTESKSLTESLILVQKKIDSVLQQEEPQ